MDHGLQRWRQKVIGRGEDDNCECREILVAVHLRRWLPVADWKRKTE